LIGKVIQKFEDRGYKLIAMKFLNAPKALLEEHYQEHKDKPWFNDYVKYIGSSPVVAMVWEG